MDFIFDQDFVMRRPWESLPASSEAIPAGSEAHPLSLVMVIITYVAGAPITIKLISRQQGTADHVTVRDCCFMCRKKLSCHFVFLKASVVMASGGA